MEVKSYVRQAEVVFEGKSPPDAAAALIRNPLRFGTMVTVESNSFRNGNVKLDLFVLRHTTFYLGGCDDS